MTDCPVSQLLQEIHNGAPWITDLGTIAVDPPDEFIKYSKDWDGDSPVFEETFVNVIIDIDEEMKRVVSGGRCLKLRSLKIEKFLKSIFHKIIESSPVEVTLEKFDMTHCHMMVSDEDCTLVFHAKEFPIEYRHSTTSPVLPVGHPSMGGQYDPRSGTSYSVKDPSFHLRNYIYTLSSNKVYLLDPKNEEFMSSKSLSSILVKNEFCTLDERKFGSIVGDINLLPRYGILFSPRAAYSLKTSAESLIHKIAHTASHSSETDISQCGEHQQHIIRTLQPQTIKRPTSTDLVADLTETIEKADVRELRKFIGKGDTGSYHGTFSTLEKMVHSALKKKCGRIEQQHESHVEELTGKGILKQHAEQYLELTASQHGSSAFRAMQVLEVVHPEYRSLINKEEFGTKAYSSSIAITVCNHVFHASSALAALTLYEDPANDVTLAAACKEAVEIQEEKTRELIRVAAAKQQQQQQQQHQQDD